MRPASSILASVLPTLLARSAADRREGRVCLAHGGRRCRRPGDAGASCSNGVLRVAVGRPALAARGEPARGRPSAAPRRAARRRDGPRSSRSALTVSRAVSAPRSAPRTAPDTRAICTPRTPHLPEFRQSSDLMRPSVIVSAVRTPTGKFLGALKDFTAPQLGALVVREAVARAGIDPAVGGRVHHGQRRVRRARAEPGAPGGARAAGSPNTVAALTINKVCGSGLKAVMLAQQGIAHRRHRRGRRRRAWSR